MNEGVSGRMTPCLEAEREELVVLHRLCLRLDDGGLLDGGFVALALARGGGDEALDLGRLALLLSRGGLELAAVGVDVLADVVLLV